MMVRNKLEGKESEKKKKKIYRKKAQARTVTPSIMYSNNAPIFPNDLALIINNTRTMEVHEKKRLLFWVEIFC